MGFFSNSPLEDAIEKATSSVNVEVNWKLITGICDMLLANPEGCDEAMRAMAKGLSGKNEAVQLHTLKLLTTASNSVPAFRRSVASRELMSVAKKLLEPRSRPPFPNPTVVKELKEALVNWMMAFQGDASLSLVQMTVTELQAAGVPFTEDLHTAAPPPRAGPTAAQLAAEREEEELAMALSASMADVQPAAGADSGVPEPAAEPPKVRGIMGKALYNFDATESNELSFEAGQHIMVFDRSDPNWWSGRAESGAEGYFPHNFITFDLDQTVAAAGQGAAGRSARDAPTTMINEETIDRTLDMIYDATQEGIRVQSTDIAEIKRLEAQCETMVPLINAKLEAIEAGEQELLALNDRYARAMALYEQMMTARAETEAGIAQRQALRPGAAATVAATAATMGQHQSPIPTAAHGSPTLPYSGAPVYVQSPATPAQLAQPSPLAQSSSLAQPSPLATPAPPTAALDPALVPAPAAAPAAAPAVDAAQVPNLADLLTAAGAGSFASPTAASPAAAAASAAPAAPAGFVSPGNFSEL